MTNQMAMQKILTLIDSTDMPTNNPSLMVRRYNYHNPLRTKITIEIDMLLKKQYKNISIINIHQVIDFLFTYNVETQTEIQKYTIFLYNTNNIVVVCHNLSNIMISRLIKINTIPTIQFISDQMAKNFIIKDYIDMDDVHYSFYRHLNTFYQVDKNLQIYIHNIIYRFIGSRKEIITGILLGGEMYIYGCILNNCLLNKIYITDTKSIYDDAILNNFKLNNRSKYYLIDYQNKKCLINCLEENTDVITKNNSILICNISKSGLTKKLCIQIINIKYLILIHCKEKSCQNDCLYLAIKYKIVNQFIYETNYKIILTFLQIK